MSILWHAEVLVALDLSGQVAQVLTDLLHDTGSALWLPGKLRQLWLRAQESGRGGGGKSFHPRIQVDPGSLRVVHRFAKVHQSRAALGGCSTVRGRMQQPHLSAPKYLLTYLLSHSRGTPLPHLHCPVGQLRSRVVGPEYVGQGFLGGGVREV